MNYFSGFCLRGEEKLFDAYRDKSTFCFSGFSYGAIKAFEKVYFSEQRVDKLQLFSPAFFQDKDAKFKKLQTLFFQKDKEAYIENFLKGISYPSDIEMKEFLHVGNIAELNELLEYVWDAKKLEKLIKRGVEIEVYVGENDQIIQPLHVKNFFQNYATIYYIKNVGHILH